MEKARTLAADLIVLDLEDAVASEYKDLARDAAAGFHGREFAIRVNGVDTPWHEADTAAVSRSTASFVVLPKAQSPAEIDALASATGKPVIAMIETPGAVLNAAAIAKTCAGLFAGTNDLGVELRVNGRAGLSLSLQMIVLAARSAGIWALDGVFNALDDAAGFASECSEGRALGFDGKTLIHPNQIDPANHAYSPTAAEVEDAHALVAAAVEGAVRFRGRMVEALHVEAARRMIERAGR